MSQGGRATLCRLDGRFKPCFVQRCSMIFIEKYPGGGLKSRKKPSKTMENHKKRAPVDSFPGGSVPDWALEKLKTGDLEPYASTAAPR